MRHWRRWLSTTLIVWVALGATLVGLTPTSKLSTAQGVGATGRPNIIFILTDDQNDATLGYMPRVKELLLNKGTRFTNFFVNLPQCCPSRASILRGQYSHNTQVLSNAAPYGGFPRFYAQGLEQSTMGTWLQEAGYHTMFVGKYLNTYPSTAADNHVPPGWDHWNGLITFPPRNSYPAYYYNYKVNRDGKLTYYGTEPEDNSTDVFADMAIQMVGHMAQDPQPFFLYLAFFAPHHPATPAPRHANLYPDVALPRPPSFNEADVSDKPLAIRQKARLTETQIATLQEEYRNRLRSLRTVDDAIANLIARLEAQNMLDNTYIVFTSDNGFHMGQHRLMMGKDTVYDEDLRVPFIIRGPGVLPGATVSALTANVDLAPTFAELAGAKTPDFVDGRSLVPLLGGATPTSWRQALLIEHWFPDTGEPRFWGLRTAGHAYFKHSTGEVELYDMQADPYQLKSLHDSAPPALSASLSARLEQLRTCRGITCRKLEE